MKAFFKECVQNSSILSFLYNKIYLGYITWKRYNVNVVDLGRNNVVMIPKNTVSDDLKITFKGNNNKIIVGNGCGFKQTNSIYIQGDNNILKIGNEVIFDQNVSIVLAEGTECLIGNGCRFADGVRIRTSDQHFIYNKEGIRINNPKGVYIGNNVWLGAYVIIMKGVSVGDGSVIGMDSMVTKDIPSKCIAVGKPAKVIKDNIMWRE